VLTVDEEVDPPRLPIGRVDVEVGNVDRHARYLELVGDRRIAEGVHAHAHGRGRRAAVRLQGVAEDLEDADLRAARRLVLQPDHPHRGHRPRAEIHARADLDQPVVRRPAPVRRLELAHHHAVAERLLSDRAADRPGEHSGLDARDPQRIVIVRTPQPVPRRDRQPQLGPVHGVRRGALRPGAPHRQVMRDPDLGVEVGRIELV
jgi:hypothetical protein